MHANMYKHELHVLMYAINRLETKLRILSFCQTEYSFKLGLKVKNSYVLLKCLELLKKLTKYIYIYY
jgi:hypothetical protein